MAGSRFIDTVAVGGGHSGLAMGKQLSRVHPVASLAGRIGFNKGWNGDDCRFSTSTLEEPSPYVSIPIHFSGYHVPMEFGSLLRRLRLAAGLTQSDLADRSGIARSNVAAYEADRREPRWSTAERLLAAVGASPVVDEPLEWRWTASRRPYAVASRLWRLEQREALRQVDLAPHLWWSGAPKTVDLSIRADRLRAYEIVLREGTPDDILGIVDAVLLCEAWPDLVLPAAAREEWERTIDELGELAQAFAA